jgi:hypothetical protein
MGFSEMKTTETRYVRCIDNTGYELSLTPRQVYEVLSDPAEVDEMLRVVDDSGEDYLFEAHLFEPIENLTELATDLTVSLTWPMKATIYRIANQRGISMSALLREWIDEHLDLPVAA